MSQITVDENGWDGNYRNAQVSLTKHNTPNQRFGDLKLNLASEAITKAVKNSFSGDQGDPAKVGYYELRYIPSQKEYQATLEMFNSYHQDWQRHENYIRRNLQSILNHPRNDPSWKKGAQKVFDYDMTSVVGGKKRAKDWMDAYVRAVQDMQTQKETDELNAAMRKQKAILEKEIAETFRIETEKLRAISEKITAQQAAMIIPDPTPQLKAHTEPLAILNEIESVPIEETTIETKSNNSKYFIIGGFAIAALVLFLILRRRK